MAVALLNSLCLLPDVIADKAIYVTEVAAIEVTWLTLVVTLALAYFASRSFLWRWRVGDYARRYVLVTGCDSGFGFDLVQRLDTLGFRVFAGCLTSEGTERVTKVTSHRVMPVSLDVTNAQNISQVVDYMESKLPPGLGLWAVVNNAGILPSMAPWELTSRDCFQRTLAVNFLGVVEVTRACASLLRRSRGARVINMSSVSGRLGFAAADYTASKFALEGFSECLRRELRKDGIHVSIITPGGFQTRLCDFDSIFDSMQITFDSLSPETRQHFGKDYVTSRRTLFTKFLRHFRWGSSSLGHVTEAYVHALSARFPRTRYVVGTDAILFFQPLWHLPACLVDLLWATWPFSLVLR